MALKHGRLENTNFYAQTWRQELISDALISDHKKQQLIPKAEIHIFLTHDTIKTKLLSHILKKIINR